MLIFIVGIVLNASSLSKGTLLGRRGFKTHDFKTNPPYFSQQQFEDIKRELGTMSAYDWGAIPEVTNMTRSKKNKVILLAFYFYYYITDDY